ncbi:MAG: DUF309 domain-containing protein [Granulosicoccus sp.]
MAKKPLPQGMTSLPEYAYLPGQNKRHPDNAFDDIRATAVNGAGAERLARCDAFLAGLHFFDKGYYWEAHEVLEPVWMALPDGSIERRFVQGLIQLANGYLKLRMGRLKAALRLVGQVRGLMPPVAGASIMSLELQEVHRWIDGLERDIICAL